MLRSLTLAACAVALTAAPAGAASVVYIQGGNVYVAGADLSDPVQVTTDGNTSAPDKTAYRSPTEADDGTIVAAKGGELFRLTQAGRVLNHFVPDTRGYPLAAAVSPDGQKVAYNFSEITQCTVYTYSCGYYPQPGSDVTPADGGGSDPAAIQEGTQDGQWIDDSTLVLQTDSSYVDYETLGQDAQHWFTPVEDDFNYVDQPVTARAGGRLALVLRPTSTGGNPTAKDVLQIYATTGAPPAAPALQCELITTDAGGFQGPVFTLDGSAVLYSDSAGLQLVTIDPASCKGGARLAVDPGPPTLAGASQASFSPAAVDPQTSTPAPAAGLSFSTTSAAVRRGKKLKVAFTVGAPGKAKVRITKRKRTKFSASGAIAAAGPAKITVSPGTTAKLRPGAYVLRLTFTPTGGVPQAAKIPLTVKR